MGVHLPHGHVKPAACRLAGSLRIGAEARDYVGRCLAGAAQQRALDDADLVVTELATNAYKHGAGPIDLSVVLTPGRVHLEVSDCSPVLPCTKDPTEFGGYGLHIVEQLSNVWGAYRIAGGKVVWADLALGPAAG